MNYLDNLKLLQKELIKDIEYCLCINNRYFYIEPNDIGFIAITNLLAEEIYHVEQIKLNDNDIFNEIKSFNLKVQKPTDYKKNLINLYETFLSFENFIMDRVVGQQLPYENNYDIKVIVNNKIYRLEFSGDMIDLFKFYFYRISSDYLDSKELTEIENKYR